MPAHFGFGPTSPMNMRDEHALTFTVDPTGAPGSQWAEPRRGPVRPALNWEITEVV